MYLNVYLSGFLVFFCVQVDGQSNFLNIPGITTPQLSDYKAKNSVNTLIENIHHIKTRLWSFLQHKIRKLQEQFAPHTVPSNPSLAPLFPGLGSSPHHSAGHWITQSMAVSPSAHPGTSWFAQSGVMYQPSPYSSAFSYPGIFQQIQSGHGVTISTFHQTGSPLQGTQPGVLPPAFYTGNKPTAPQPGLPFPAVPPGVSPTIDLPQVLRPTIRPEETTPTAQPGANSTQQGPAQQSMNTTAVGPGVVAQSGTSAATQNVTQPITQNSTSVTPNVTSVSLQNATSTGVQNTTSTGGQNATSTGVQNVALTGGQNTTSPGVQNATSVGVPNSTAVGGQNLTSTGVQNATSPGIQNATSVSVLNATSPGVQNTTSADLQNTTPTGVHNVNSTGSQNVILSGSQNSTFLVGHNATVPTAQNVSSSVAPDVNTTSLSNQTEHEAEVAPRPASATHWWKPVTASPATDFEERSGPRALCY